jgi:hypothetical protein
MSHAHFHRAHMFSRRGIVIAIVAAIGFPVHAASAQLGGLVKKARDKVVENQVEKQIDKRTGTASDPGAPPKFDEVTVELTSDRLAQMIRGLSAGRAVLDGTSGSPGRATLVARRDEAANKSGNLASDNAKLLNAYTEKRDVSERCHNDAMRASQEKRHAAAEQRNKELQAKAMSDPAYREKVIALTQKMGEAQARGDTVALKKLAAEFGLTPDDAKPDTIAADKACGPLPSKPAVLVQMEQLDAQVRALSEQIRQLEEKSSATEIKESGLTERQFFMARERVEAYLSAVKYKSQPRGFSASELEALGAQRASLEKVM